MRRSDQLLMSSKADEAAGKPVATHRGGSLKTIGPTKGDHCGIAARLEIKVIPGCNGAKHIPSDPGARREGALHSAF